MKSKEIISLICKALSDDRESTDNKEIFEKLFNENGKQIF